MTAEELAAMVRAVELSEQDVFDVRIVKDQKAGLLAVGLFKTIDGTGVVLVRCPAGGRPCVLRLEGDHKTALWQMLGTVLDEDE